MIGQDDYRPAAAKNIGYFFSLRFEHLICSLLSGCNDNFNKYDRKSIYPNS